MKLVRSVSTRDAQAQNSLLSPCGTNTTSKMRNKYLEAFILSQDMTIKMTPSINSFINIYKILNTLLENKRSITLSRANIEDHYSCAVNRNHRVDYIDNINDRTPRNQSL